MLRYVKAKSLYALVVVAAASAVGARAASISDGNSTLTINPSSSTLPFITNWVVDGVDQFGGSPAGGETLSFAVNPPALVNQLNSLTVTNSSFSNGIASVSYKGAGFTVGVKEVLSGGNPGSGASGINETITVTNTGTPTLVNSVTPADGVGLVFDLTDFVNLNVNGTPANDTLTLSPATGTNTADQTDPTGVKVNWVATPTPDAIQTIDIPSGNPGATLGPVTGDEGFSARWGITLAQGDSEIVSVTETLSGPNHAVAVPAPNSAWNILATLAGLGVFGAVRRMRRAAR